MTNIVGETSNRVGPLPVAEKPLAGRTALVVGVANKDSIAYGVARALRGFGADVSMTYLNDKPRSYTEELATALEVRPELFLKCDVRVEGQMESVMVALCEHWDKLNVLIHSIAFAPKDGANAIEWINTFNLSQCSQSATITDSICPSTRTSHLRKSSGRT